MLRPLSRLKGVINEPENILGKTLQAVGEANANVLRKEHACVLRKAMELSECSGGDHGEGDRREAPRDNRRSDHAGLCGFLQKLDFFLE